MTRALAMADALQQFEKENSSDGRGACSEHCGESLGAAEHQQDAAQRVPKPAIAATRRGNHPETKPSGRTPAMHLAHNSAIATIDVSPDGARECHGVFSIPAGRSAGPILVPLRRRRRGGTTCRDQRRANNCSDARFPHVNAGTSSAIGSSGIFQGESRKISHTTRIATRLVCAKLPLEPRARHDPRRSPTRNSSLLDAPGTSVYAAAAAQMVCASLPPSATFSVRRARRAACRLVSGNMWPFKVSNAGKQSTNHLKSSSL